ncbi:replication-associated protein [Gopherus associated circular DNA virus 3]|nr:replication-associated protein [Gopherus associated circular DNA virus 3]
MPGGFRVNSKTFFLTFARCSIDLEELQNHVIARIPESKFEYIVTAHELHDDGGDHRHVFFTVKRKWDIRNERHFDFTTEEGTVYHPSIESPRNPIGARQYTQKDGNYIEQGEAPSRVLPQSEQEPPGPNKRDAAFAALDASTDCVEDFMQELRARHPYEFFTRGNQASYASVILTISKLIEKQIRANVESVKRKRWVYEGEFPPNSFTVPAEVQNWLDSEFEKENRSARPKALMLVGPSKTGKTHWARSLGRHIFFREQYDLEQFDKEADYVVFDDLEIDRVHAIKCWLGSMGEFSDTDKYKPKIRLHWGPYKCCIILCNPGVDWRYSDRWKKEREWFESNVITVEINENLF